MKKNIGIILLFCLSLMRAEAQVEVKATIDSLAILMGEQIGITLEVTSPKSTTVIMPKHEVGKELTAGVEIIDITKDDTLKQKNDMRRIVRRYTITSFAPNAYMIPPFKIKADGKQHTTNPLALKVLGVDVDTLHIDKFYPPKDVQDNPFLWAEWSMMFWLSAIMVLLCMMVVYLYVRLRQNKPIISRFFIIRHVPPHKRALGEIEKLRTKHLQHADDAKEYYTLLTDALRKYIEERFAFAAMEMTSNEIIAKLYEIGEDKAAVELKVLFETADLVKFAKHSTQLNENDLNMTNAVNFIENTKTGTDQTVEERVASKLSEDDEKAKNNRQSIQILMLVLGVLITLCFGLIVYSLINIL